MDFSRDELHRQLRISRQEHDAAMKPWREALLRVFGRESRFPRHAKAELLGVPVPGAGPGRRELFRIGGATILGAAILAACSDNGGQGGDAVATATDITLLRTASSLEVLVVNTYQAALASGLVTDTNVAALATLFREQHNEHAQQLQSVTTDAGGEAFTDPNPVVQQTVVDPALAALTDQASVVAFASTLESVAAETYAFAAGSLSTPAFRQAIMAIGGVEARHVAILSGVLGAPQVPAALMPTIDHVAKAAFV